MKIACLVKPGPPMNYFVNTIHRRHGVATVIVETGARGGRNLARKIRKHGVLRSLQLTALRFCDRNRQASDCERVFGEGWKRFDPSVPCLEVEQINSQTTHRALADLDPDLLLDHGTSIVKDSVLSTSKLALNLHWGLSPYYRGTYCTNWALLNWDPHNIGVTIHKLSSDIDGGEIVEQRRAVITARDTCHSINMQLTKLGTEAVLSTISRMRDGEPLVFYPQDFAKGSLTTIRQWSWLLELQIRRIERKGVIGVMLKRPASSNLVPLAGQHLV